MSSRRLDFAEEEIDQVESHAGVESKESDRYSSSSFAAARLRSAVKILSLRGEVAESELNVFDRLWGAKTNQHDSARWQRAGTLSFYDSSTRL